MLIVGYCFGIRSERRLCEEVHLNLAYRWFSGLGLDGDVPGGEDSTRGPMMAPITISRHHGPYHRYTSPQCDLSALLVGSPMAC